MKFKSILLRPLKNESGILICFLKALSILPCFDARRLGNKVGMKRIFYHAPSALGNPRVRKSVLAVVFADIFYAQKGQPLLKGDASPTVSVLDASGDNLAIVPRSL